MVTVSKMTTLKQKRFQLEAFTRKVAVGRMEIDEFRAAGDAVGPHVVCKMGHIKGDAELIKEFFSDCVEVFSAAFSPLFGRASLDMIQQPVSREWMAVMSVGLTEQRQLSELAQLMEEHGIKPSAAKAQA